MTYHLIINLRLSGMSTTWYVLIAHARAPPLLPCSLSSRVL